MNSPAYFLNSKPIMTHYEFTRIRGIRLQQLEDGSKPFVDTLGLNSHEEIFEKEAKNNKLPFVVERNMNDNTFFVKASEMFIDFQKM